MLDWLKALFLVPASTDDHLPQLEMIRDDFEGLPPIVVPDGYVLRTYQPGDEVAWCEIMEGNVGQNWTVERSRDRMFDDPRFEPENLFFATRDDRPVASACAWRRDVEETTIGDIHMVAALPEHRGRGLGQLVNAAVLHRLRDLGFRKAHLKTDDWRLAAIKSYVKADFRPLNTHDSHPERWEIIFDQLASPADPAV